MQGQEVRRTKDRRDFEIKQATKAKTHDRDKIKAYTFQCIFLFPFHQFDIVITGKITTQCR